jgi:hypothetical protein
MNYINTTPHDVNMNDGRVFQKNPCTVRCEMFYENDAEIIPTKLGDVVGLPEPVEGTTYIVSLPTLLMLRGTRKDCVAPATDHASCVKNDKGHVVGVSHFITLQF